MVKRYKRRAARLCLVRKSDDQPGWVYVVTGFGKVPCELIKVGRTRNPPSSRGFSVLGSNFSHYWPMSERDLLRHYKENPPALWAVPVNANVTAEREVHRLLADRRVYVRKNIREVPDPLKIIIPYSLPFKRELFHASLTAALDAMRLVAGVEPEQFDLKSL